MPDPRRLESPTTSEAADRDSRTEALLVDGLDRYFSGQYEDAIHLWTRVLFLDRSHARARAYIDRARTSLAERQRRAEEMLHATSELLAQGQTDEARSLLSRADATSADDAHMAELRARLDRAERAGVGRLASAPPAVVDAIPVGTWRPGFRSSMTAAVVVLSVALVLVLGSATVRDWLGLGQTSPALAVVGRNAPLPVLSSSETALVRARTLYSRGRLAEALRVLDRVDPESSSRAAADRLRVEIQQMLLGTRQGPPSIATDASRGQP